MAGGGGDVDRRRRGVGRVGVVVGPGESERRGERDGGDGGGGGSVRAASEDRWAGSTRVSKDGGGECERGERFEERGDGVGAADRLGVAGATRTRVLPVPAPAITRSGPSGWVAAARWSALSP